LLKNEEARDVGNAAGLLIRRWQLVSSQTLILTPEIFLLFAQSVFFPLRDDAKQGDLGITGDVLPLVLQDGDLLGEYGDFLAKFRVLFPDFSVVPAQITHIFFKVPELLLRQGQRLREVGNLLHDFIHAGAISPLA
jgi:hypothetical protein